MAVVKRIVSSLNPRAKARRRKRLEQQEALKAFVNTEQNRSEGVFDEDWYYAAYPDVLAEGFDAVTHYLNHGYRENRQPGPRFDTAFYLQNNPDVIAAGLNPLLHYLNSGRLEGRAPNRDALARPALDPRHVVVKDMILSASGETAILVAHAAAGRLRPHVLPYIEALRGNGIAVLLVAVADRPVEFTEAELAAVDGAIVRDNVGYDFAAWADALRLVNAVWASTILYLTNDSVVPSADPAAMSAMLGRVRGSDADVVGLTASHEYGWHIQSYFLAFKPTALSSWAFQFFFRDMTLHSTKDAVISGYEVPLAARMRSAGLTVAALFGSPFAINPTLFGWRELIEQGFPFVKLLLLRDSFPAADTRKWRAFLHAAGFDVPMIEATILASGLTDPGQPSGELLARPEILGDKSPSRPLHVAYIGPWNYDNGLGQASRELLCALRRTDYLLNVSPIIAPFHIHRLISPAVEQCDFDGPPDIAIVHLNPDSWHLLSEGQHALVRSARHRVGYWVWETDTVPPAWQHDLRSVDHIWAPTRYCADIFRTVSDVPIDVIPHPIELPIPRATDRPATLARYGIDANERIILFVFDGASYLIRKNPDALIRAFAASGLAKCGWRLLLKTKHLFDRPEAGAALAALTRATPGVLLLDASLNADDLANLLDAASIYTSPHCSEGFGMTIAEAMALGKPVVATDYSGPRDFLDASCGYPVPATEWMLTEDHGHYLSGHVWGRVDEVALADALCRAARAVEAGDTTIGDAARAAIEVKLSYDAVARAIVASLDNAGLTAMRAGADLSATPTIPLPPPPPILPVIDVSQAMLFALAVPVNGIVPIALDPDLSFPVHVLSAIADLPHESDWLFFAARDARLAPGAFDFALSAIAARPDVSLFYADDIAQTEEPLDRVRLKPDFDPTLLAVQDYIGVPVIVRARLVGELGGVQASLGPAALYDLVMRASERTPIARIPHVLLAHDRARTAVTPAQRRTVVRAINRYADYDLTEDRDGRSRLVRRFGEALPPVSILIPTRRSRVPEKNVSYLELLLERLARTDWPMDRLTVIVGDDDGSDSHWATKPWPFTLRRIHTPRAPSERFNYAAKMNLLWRIAADEQIVLMNDDALPQDDGWLKALQTFALDKTVGGVGARLFYRNGAIQHAGIFPTLRIAVHAWIGMAEDAATYQDWAAMQRQWSMVTGAVFATRRSTMDRVAGFDEKFSLEFNDLDLCLRMRALGYGIVYAPDARFTHAEKASRGTSPPPAEEVALFLKRWSAWLDQDPASHPGYAKDRVDIVPAVVKKAWYTA